MRVPALRWLVLAACLIWLGAALAPELLFGLRPSSSLTEDEVAELLALIRDDKSPTLPESLSAKADEPISAVLTVWHQGERKRVKPVADLPLAEAAKELARGVPRPGVTKRMQLDVIVGEGWLPRRGLFARQAFVEGHDGIAGSIEGEPVFVLPLELIHAKAYGSDRPVPWFDPSFKNGLDFDKLESDLVDRSRIRVVTVVEGHDGEPLVLRKATTERPPLTRAALRASALAGGRYLQSTLRRNGQFRYYYDPFTDQDKGSGYNWTRHAGATWSLALVGRTLDQPDLAEAAAPPLFAMLDNMVDGPDGRRCLTTRGRCYVGLSALGLLALSEYRDATGDPGFDRDAAQLADFLQLMQRPDGSFRHEWWPDKGIKDRVMKLYADAQCVLALARYSRVTGDEAARASAIRGMDWLSGPYWDTFLGSFFFYSDHWSCLAAEEVYALEPDPAYAERCLAIGDDGARSVHEPGETPWSEDVGGSTVTHIPTPYVGGTAATAESMVSAVVLGEALGSDTTYLRIQLERSLTFLLGGQVTIHDTFFHPSPRRSLGGFYDTRAEPAIRVDTVQHAISAIARGVEVLGALPEGDAEQAAARYEWSPPQTGSRSPRTFGKPSLRGAPGITSPAELRRESGSAWNPPTGWEEVELEEPDPRETRRKLGGRPSKQR